MPTVFKSFLIFEFLVFLIFPKKKGKNLVRYLSKNTALIDNSNGSGSGGSDTFTHLYSSSPVPVRLTLSIVRVSPEKENCRRCGGAAAA